MRKTLEKYQVKKLTEYFLNHRHKGFTPKKQGQLKIGISVSIFHHINELEVGGKPPKSKRCQK